MRCRMLDFLGAMVAQVVALSLLGLMVAAILALAVLPIAVLRYLWRKGNPHG